MSTILPRHLHGGKWSQEEELYAQALMEAFKAGELDPKDCPEGTSLRKYLAKKLMCSPKRVSKKYEGTGYNGKQVYIKQQQNGLLANPALRLARQAKMDMLERNFLASMTEVQQGETRGSGAAVPQANPTQNLYASAYASLPGASPSLASQQGDLLGTATESAFASLRARSDLTALIQERDRLDALLNKSQIDPLWGSVSAADMFLAAPQSNTDISMLLEKERMRQAALASNLTRSRLSLATSNPLAGLDLLGGTASLAGTGAPNAAVLEQLELESRLKRAMEEDVALRIKRARLQF